MTRQVMGGLVLPALLLAVVAFGAPAGAANDRTANGGNASLRPGSATVSDLAGRYKKQGNQCLWDAADNGPDQCTPVTKGRFKKSGDNCVWDTADTGADQCKPAKGRFKKDGAACVFNASDSGPDQCNPRDVK